VDKWWIWVYNYATVYIIYLIGSSGFHKSELDTTTN